MSGFPKNSCEAIWLDDGNVILRSGDVMHRVHRSVIGKYSDFFQRVFLVQKELNSDYENPPVLSVTDNELALLHYVRARYNEDRLVRFTMSGIAPA